ncbi:DedA family protein [Microbacterium sp. 1P10UB]|uniref:DedA family protein n=1 Tax=unclassified Microbacterium TaxID=2609290 RepID=UPI0013709F05|nr:DedA family protein [Microbacterium sp. TL13]MXS75484.1 DedA family protein [Microbacterium sp. TL13]
MSTATVMAAAAAGADPHNFTGIVGFGVNLMYGIGEWGVGVFTFLETVFPPIPSELILPLAGFLTHDNGMNFGLLVLTSTLGAYLGAVVLYALGAWAGLERSIRWLSRLPLVDRSDFERAASWFSRHSRSAVFFGRLIPGVRSLISLPAGAERMNFWRFSLLTVAGSAIWNALLIGGGVLLGTQYDLVERYSNLLSYLVYAAIGGVVVYLVIRQLRRSAARRRVAGDDAG